MSNNIIEFLRISHRYPGGQDVLSDISFTLKQGELAFLTGSSGAGKSTILRLSAALARPARGQLHVNGYKLNDLKRGRIPEFRQRLGLVFQNFNLLQDRSVYDNVALPLVIRGYAQRDIGRYVRAALDQVGLLDKEKVLPMFLAGGEQQRVGIARAVVTKPDLLLADEPTGNLDPEMALDVMKIFGRFNQVGVSVLIATHAIDLITRMNYRILHLENGRITAKTPVSVQQLRNPPHGA